LPKKIIFAIIPVFTDEGANKTPKTLPVKRSRALPAYEGAPVRYFSLSLDQRRRRASRRIAPRNATLRDDKISRRNGFWQEISLDT
jgi:hypothetical protein